MEKNKKITKRKSLFLLFLVIFIVGNISFYLKERAKWIYDGQPYPKAKEWLVPANMMLVYGTTLTKLPFIDERSFIMKPIIGLQDYFVSKWQENLPSDDAEKYLGWYMFKLRTYMIPNTGSVTLRGKNKYSNKEVIKADEKAWKTIEAMVKYKAKDKIFKDIRYTAFLNLAFFYVKNVYVYWYHEKSDVFNIYSMNKHKQYIFDKKLMYKDIEKLQRFHELYKYIPKLRLYYKKNYPILYKEFDIPYFNYLTMYILTDYLLDYQIDKVKKESMDFKYFCNQDTNLFLQKHLESKNRLISLINNNHELTGDIKFYFTESIDSELQNICNENIKYGEK